MAKTQVGQAYFALRAMGYAGKRLEAGQLFDPGRYPNTQMMEGLGWYFAPVTDEHPCPTCVRCNITFATERYLEAHQRICPNREVALDDVNVSSPPGPAKLSKEEIGRRMLEAMDSMGKVEDPDAY